jgi:hypothetical protein
MKKNRLYLLFVLALSCRNLKQNPSSQPQEAGDSGAPPSGAELYLIAPERLSCEGTTPWPQGLLDRMIQNEDLPQEHFEAQKLALRDALSSLPPELGIQILAHGGKVGIARNPSQKCHLDPSLTKESDIAYCTLEEENGFKIFLGAYEKDQPSLKQAQSDGVYALLEAYVHTVMTNDPTPEGFLPEAYDVSLYAGEAFGLLYDRMVKERGLNLPRETQEDLFTLLAYMSLCSQVTRDDLEALLPGARKEVLQVIAVSYEDDKGDGGAMDQLAQELGLGGEGLGLSGLGSLFSGIRGVLPGGSPGGVGGVAPRAGQGFRADNGVYRAGIEDYNARRVAAGFAAVEPEDMNRIVYKGARALESVGRYRSDLGAIRQSQEFRELYQSRVFSQVSGENFFQIPKKTQSVEEGGVSREKLVESTVDPKTSDTITITIPGTFEGQGTKVGGTWFDPGGPTAKGYQKAMNGKEPTDKDFIASFRWNGENSKESRDAAGVALANELLGMVAGNTTNPLKINLIGHSHGGNVGYKALSEIVELAKQSDNVGLAAKKFIEKTESGEIKLDMLAIATPRRKDYLPPAWAKTTHISVKGDGVAWLGKVDGVNQLKRFRSPSNRGRKKAWADYEKESKGNFKRITIQTYGMDKAFLENHILAPESLLGRMEGISFQGFRSPQ